jgi:hypothetical protein
MSTLETSKIVTKVVPESSISSPASGGSRLGRQDEEIDIKVVHRSTTEESRQSKVTWDIVVAGIAILYCLWYIVRQMTK